MVSYISLPPHTRVGSSMAQLSTAAAPAYSFCMFVLRPYHTDIVSHIALGDRERRRRLFFLVDRTAIHLRRAVKSVSK